MPSLRKGPSMNNVCTLARAPGGQIRSGRTPTDWNRWWRSFRIMGLGASFQYTNICRDLSRRKDMTAGSKSATNVIKSIWQRHSLSIIPAGILLSWFILYQISNPTSRFGSFFGNAIADWTGVLITILATKWFFEKGSKESRRPRWKYKSLIREFFHEHSLTVFLLISGVGWVILYSRVDPGSKWGTVISNIVSEWSQQIGLVLLTKKFVEAGSKESSG